MAKRAIDLVIRFMSEQKTLEQVRACDSFLPPSSAASFSCLFSRAAASTTRQIFFFPLSFIRGDDDEAVIKM